MFLIWVIFSGRKFDTLVIFTIKKANNVAPADFQAGPELKMDQINSTSVPVYQTL